MCLDHLDQLKALSRKQLDDSLHCHEPLLGDWVVVEYDGNHFPGQVTEMHVETKEAPVKCMFQQRLLDIIAGLNSVVMKLQMATTTTNRGDVFNFED